jgi:tRNA(adenine34) deaminase
MSDPRPLPAYDPAAAEQWMRQALDEARAAMDRNEVPVGCVVVAPDGRVAGRGQDRRQAAADPLGHAEVEAIRAAAAAQDDWRLDGHTLVSTLEPCPMCAGLILLARIGRVVFGAPNHKWGAAGTRLDLLASDRFPHRPEVIGGLLASPCAQLLSDYFRRRR